RNQLLRLVEAILFAAAEPLDEATIAARLPEDSDTTALIADVAELYRNRGVNLVRVAGKWAFRTAPDLAPRLALEREAARRLSRAAIETLAIIAYHQPVTRAEIESIRGVAVSKGTLDVLLEANWIKPGRRRQSPGRPVTWVTNEVFLDHFGLDSLKDLPGLKELKAAGLLDSRPAISAYSSVGEEPDLFPDEASDEEGSEAPEAEPLEPEEDK
ncbi:MAG: SMC-Scp complex subunit ScpB, partial [Alphaproteobacteria bacterium]